MNFQNMFINDYVVSYSVVIHRKSVFPLFLDYVEHYLTSLCYQLVHFLIQ